MSKPTNGVEFPFQCRYQGDIKDPLPLFKSNKVVTLVAGFSSSSHRRGYRAQWRSGLETLMRPPRRIGPQLESVP